MGTPQFYGVTTTGIYCRFGCPSRTPRPENVVYLADSADAHEHGLRPCKRCRPDQHVAPHEAFKVFLCSQLLLIAQDHPELTIREYAQKLSISTRQLERITLEHTGMSPRTFIANNERISS